MIAVLIVMVWQISLVLAFFVGRHYKAKPRYDKEEMRLTEEDARQIERERREQENFMKYDGTPQDVINT